MHFWKASLNDSFGYYFVLFLLLLAFDSIITTAFRWQLFVTAFK